MSREMEIGNRIRDSREKRGLTQEELGLFLGLNKSTIQRYETGKISRIKLPVLEAMAEELGVNPEYLALKTDDPIRYEETEENLNAPSDVNEYFNGDAKKIYEFQKIVEHDAQSEDIPETPKLRSIARLENSSFTPDEDDEILNFIKYIESKRNGGE